MHTNKVARVLLYFEASLHGVLQSRHCLFKWLFLVFPIYYLEVLDYSFAVAVSNRKQAFNQSYWRLTFINLNTLLHPNIVELTLRLRLVLLFPVRRALVACVGLSGAEHYQQLDILVPKHLEKVSNRIDSRSLCCNESPPIRAHLRVQKAG